MVNSRQIEFRIFFLKAVNMYFAFYVGPFGTQVDKIYKFPICGSPPSHCSECTPRWMVCRVL